MVTTRDPKWDARFRLLRQHAMSVPDTVRHGSNQVIFESYPTVGYNYRMTDIQAAIGREQLKRLPQIIAERRKLASRYADRLASVPGLELPWEPPTARSNWQSFCVGLPAHCDQVQVMQAMLDAGISTRRGVMCTHREPAYREQPQANPLPNSERVQDRCILLPLYPGMTADDQDKVVETLARECSSALQAA